MHRKFSLLTLISFFLYLGALIGLYRVRNAWSPVRSMATGNDRISTLCSSVSGRILCVGFISGKIQVFDLASGTDYDVAGARMGQVLSMSISPETLLLAVAYGNGEVGLYDLRNRRRVCSRTFGTDIVQNITFNCRGDKIGLTSQFGRGWISDRNLQNVQVAFDFDFPSSSGMIFLEDETIIYESPKHELSISNSESLQSVKFIRGHDGGISNIAKSPSGRLLCTSSYDGSVKIWDASSLSVVRDVFGDIPQYCAGFDASETLVWILGKDGAVRIYGVTDHHYFDELPSRGEPARAVTYLSPGGQIVIASDAFLDIYEQVRSPGYIGLFRSFEFWLMIFCSGLLIFSIFRDRKLFLSSAKLKCAD